MAVCAGSQRARHSAGWSRRHWPVSLGRLWMQCAHRISLPCPQGRAPIAFTDADPSRTVFSINGVGAYYHVFRSSFFAKLHSVPSLQGLLPFLRSVYARPTTYVWEGGTGARHQGDPLMPLFFSLGIHDSLRAVDERLRPEDKLFAYLDDVHVVSPPHRTRVAYNILAEQILTGAGIQLHTGKTRVWNRGGTSPAGRRIGRRGLEPLRH